MVTLETTSDLDIARIEDWFEDDSHRIGFTVEQNGTPRDVTDDDITWGLYELAYDFSDNTPVISDSDPGVSIQRDPITDPTQGEFEVRVQEETLDDWGEFWQFITIDPINTTRQAWRGEVWIESS